MNRKQLAILALALALTGAALADGNATPPAATAPAATAADPGSKTCPQQTGTRLPRKAGDCLPSPGRSYDSEELQSTGQVNLSDALRRVDPTVSGH